MSSLALVVLESVATSEGVVDNSRLVPYTPQSVAASLAAVKSGRNTQLLKEESDFRNERDVVPAGIRTGPNPQIFLFSFFDRWCPETRRRGREFLEFLSFLSFFVCLPWELVSGWGVFLY
jgi:hypothetical protein